MIHHKYKLSDTYNIHIHFCVIIIVFLSAKRCSCVDQKYLDCAPRNCGNLSISFPFFMAGVQPAYCGSPGFNITCENNKDLFLHIPEDNQDLLVDGIVYDDSFLRVYYPDFRSNSGTCGGIRKIASNIYNLALDGDHFQLLLVSKIVLFFNCSTDTRLDKYRVPCDGIEYLVMNKEDLKFGLARGECGDGGWVEAPIASCGDDITSMNYLTVLRRGFFLKWRASDCSGCRLTGGRCGFEADKDLFLCFCQDRPHYKNCTSSPVRPGKSFKLLHD